MPCYEVNTVSVAFSPQHYAILLKAVTALSGTMQRNAGIATVVLDGMTITIKDGVAECRSSVPQAVINSTINKLRVGYSQAVLDAAKSQATSKGWKAQSAGPNKLTVKKGRAL